MVRHVLLALTGLALVSFSWGQIRVTVEAPPPPVLVISAELRVALAPGVAVVERATEPQGILVVYRSDRIAEVYEHHHRDLTNRGWVRVKHQVSPGRYKSEYRRGNAKARLEVQERRGRLEVRVKEG
ncbi:MAG: hypothetical protein NZ849_04605 [Meiothermus sp.]|uniref:hypothetical protein n=1 Tax=Meiothermus sp. TaxID=1955249 RepID=UPI0025ECDAA7|nr:hypothetical protein [Meiothermus sp.]MCS7059019.1 hypothetical protein [Meiothermus sp.]MCS7194178.1 hypothetical protein [Meiothermus sp.]MCX7740642.1 hypothetical protein [Meiothermus sp.]MDW8090039.1 hypothetical protein [Meiothermus sp.]MDW8480687.1 hypothetical protein [Meiothermus sp.]